MHISAVIIIIVILLIFFLAFAFNLTLLAAYKKLKRDFDRKPAVRGSASAAGASADGVPDIFDRFTEPRFRSALLRNIVSEFETAWTAQKGIEVNTQAIIEKNFNARIKSAIFMESCARHSVSVMIVLGLLGTFIGLTISVQSLVLLFRGYDVTELLSSVESGLLSALSGMSTAFTTSLFGIACSVVVTVMNVFVNPGQTRENLMTGIEEYLDNTVSARLRAAAGDGYEKMNEALRGTFIEFGERIAERFDRSLTTLRDDVRGIEEVNNNLRNTIEQMDVSFVRISDALKASTRHVDDNYQALASLSAQYKEVSDGFDSVRKENAAHSEALVGSVTEAAKAIADLTGDLRGEAQRRLDNFAAYDAAIAQMAASAELIRGAVAAIPDQMYAYTEASKIGAGVGAGVGASAGVGTISGAGTVSGAGTGAGTFRAGGGAYGAADEINWATDTANATDSADAEGGAVAADAEGAAFATNAENVENAAGDAAASYEGAPPDGGDDDDEGGWSRST